VDSQQGDDHHDGKPLKRRGSFLMMATSSGDGASSGGDDGELEESLRDYKSERNGMLKCLVEVKGERNNVAKELYHSELTYLTGLQRLVLVIKRPLRLLGLPKSPFTAEERDRLFGNAEELLRLHEELIKKLDMRYMSWSDTQCIGDVLSDFAAEAEEHYVGYCKNHDAAASLFEQLARDKSKVSAFQQKALPVCDHQPIPALLILPVQRIPRYELLLRDLMKKTPTEHPDYAQIKAAQARLNALSTRINEAIRAHEKEQAFTEVQSNIHGLEDLQKNQERFLFEASYQIRSVDHGDADAIDEATARRLKAEWGKSARIVLFNNVLVFARKEDQKQKKSNKSNKSKSKGGGGVGAEGAAGVAGKRFFLHQLWVDEVPAERLRVVLKAPELRIHLEAGSVLDTTQTIDNIRAAVDTWCAARPNLVRKLDDGTTTCRVFHHNFADGRKYKGDWRDCVPRGQGRINYPNGNTYEGANEALAPSGAGAMSFADGSRYEGEWRDGVPYGRGTLHFADAAGFYVGEWQRGRQHGAGEMSWTLTGDSYAGEWRSSAMHGSGLYLYADGSFYEGEWDSSRWHGRGTHRCADGAIYEGQFERNCRHGAGNMRYSNGDVYEGRWVDGQRDGDGTLVMANQRGSYEGQWEVNAMSGRGRLVLATGAVYEGQWRNSKRHGEGQQRYADGSTYDGGWADDRRSQRGIFHSASGLSYEGSWHNDLFFGSGDLVDVDGARYRGKFMKGRRTGHGSQDYPNGDRYEGEWRNDQRHGRGIYRRADGRVVYAGHWEYDQRHGQGQLFYGAGALAAAKSAIDDIVSALGGAGADGSGTVASAADDASGDDDAASGSLSPSRSSSVAKEAAAAEQPSTPSVYKYNGAFERDSMSGHGCLTDPKGRSWTGAWVDGVRDGHHVLALADGNVHDQLWVDGLLLAPPGSDGGSLGNVGAATSMPTASSSSSALGGPLLFNKEKQKEKERQAAAAEEPLKAAANAVPTVCPNMPALLLPSMHGFEIASVSSV
jgi:hypothetical protein